MVFIKGVPIKSGPFGCGAVTETVAIILGLVTIKFFLIVNFLKFND